MQKQLLAYIKTKPARDGLRAQKTGKARRTYREQHESEFIISESAARYFKAQGISKLPASKALQTEIELLTKAKNALYNEYREKKENVRELQTVKGNIARRGFCQLCGGISPSITYYARQGKSGKVPRNFFSCFHNSI